MFDDDFLYDSSPAGLAFQELLEEDLTPTPKDAEKQPSPSTTVPAVPNKPQKRFQQCELLVTEHPSSHNVAGSPTVTQPLLSTRIVEGIQAIHESSATHEDAEDKPSAPSNKHYVEITDDHRALAEELQKYTCPPLDLLDKGANAFLTLVTGVQHGEPYRRRPRTTVESTTDEEEAMSIPQTEFDDGDLPYELKKKVMQFFSASDKEQIVPAGGEGSSFSVKDKKLNLLFPHPDKEESAFVKRMKTIPTNGPRFGDNVVYMEQLEAMNERIEALERQLKLTHRQIETPVVSPISTPTQVKTQRSSTSSKSDDFEVVSQSEKLSTQQLEAALADAKERIAEAERRRDEMADQYNKLLQNMMETVMNSAR